jgi:hypothetical protein
MKKKYDDGLEWLRQVRREISEECDHDVGRLLELYRKAQREHPGGTYKAHPASSNGLPSKIKKGGSAHKRKTLAEVG